MMALQRLPGGRLWGGVVYIVERKKQGFSAAGPGLSATQRRR